MKTLVFGRNGMETAISTPELPLYCRVNFEGYGHGDGAIISPRNEHGDYKCVSIVEGDHIFYTIGTHARPLSKKFGIGVYYYDSLETVDEVIVKEMIEKAHAADAEREATKNRIANAYAQEVASLPALHPHLTPVKSMNGDWKTDKAARKANLVAELRHHFPNVQFSVRNEHHSTYNITWVNGPTDKEVTNVINQFKDSDFDGMTDSTVHYSNAFADVFGSFSYIFTRRSWSNEVEELWNANKHLWGNGDRDQFNESFREQSFPAGATITKWEDNVFMFTLPDETASAPITAGDIIIEDYNDKSFVVRGNTKPIKDDLKALGGFFSFRLKGGPAWCFSLKKKEAVKQALGLASMVLIMLFASTMNAQTSVTSWSGKTIPVKAIAGADVTIAPVEQFLSQQHVGWLQIGITVWPVYQGPRGGLFTYRPNTVGEKTRYSVTAAQRARVVMEVS